MPGFKKLLILAKADDPKAIEKIINMYQRLAARRSYEDGKFNDDLPKAIEKIINMYQRLAARRSYEDGKFNDDLYQILLTTIWKCIQTFKPEIPW